MHHHHHITESNLDYIFIITNEFILPSYVFMILISIALVPNKGFF